MEELIVNEKKIREKIEEVINNSNLPAFILMSILKDFYEQLELIDKEQYKTALKMIEEKKNNSKKEEK